MTLLIDRRLVHTQCVHRYWLLTWTTYATRLPGDRRGFVSTVRSASGARRRNNTPGTPFDRDLPALRESARRSLRQPPVFLAPEQARVVERELRATSEIRSWALPAGAVMANHVHAVVGLTSPGDTADAARATGRFKAFASRELNRQFERRPTWWTQGGSRRLLRDEAAVGAAIRYVANQYACLALYVDDEWRALLGL